MTPTSHRATPGQWAKCESDAANWSGAFNCILELRARVEALEGRDAELRKRISELEAKLSPRFVVPASAATPEQLEELRNTDREGWALLCVRRFNSSSQPSGLLP